MMDSKKLLDETIKKVLFEVGRMERQELNSFIDFGQNTFEIYKNVILPNAYLNKHLEPFEKMAIEKQHALLCAIIVLHGMCDAETRLQEKTD